MYLSGFSKKFDYFIKFFNKLPQSTPLSSPKSSVNVSIPYTCVKARDSISGNKVNEAGRLYWDISNNIWEPWRNSANSGMSDNNLAGRNNDISENVPINRNNSSWRDSANNGRKIWRIHIYLD